MPYCHALSPAGLQKGLSAARLNAYQSLVGAATAEDAVGVYVWSLELNAALGPLLSWVEVLLRNAVQVAATTAFGKPDWHQDVLKWQGGQEFMGKVAADPHLPEAFWRPGCSPYDKKAYWVGATKHKPRRYFSAAESKREEILRRLTREGKANTPDQMVAHSMIGYWLDLFAVGFEGADALALWPQCTAAVFPHDATMSRARAAQYLNDIKKLRNRMSHHEPVWSSALPRTPAGVHRYMTQQVRQMVELIGAMSQDVLMLLHNCGALVRIDSLLQPQTIAHYTGQGAARTIDLRRLKRTVGKLAQSASRRRSTGVPVSPGKAIHLVIGGVPVVTLLPHS